MSGAAVKVAGLSTCFAGGSETVHAVDRVSFEIAPGETFALVGESGCGKSVTALSLMRLLPDAAQIAAGEVRLDQIDLLDLPEAAMRSVRGRRVAMIFQEPTTSLNPVMTVGQQIEEVLRRHRELRGAAARARAIELLSAVGIPDPARRLDDYPFQLSGGMKQRVMIAIALAGEPDLIVADEPTTALDVTIQAQVLDLLRDIQRERGTSLLLITHDLGVVATIAHRVGVMYAGEIVEMASREQFFRQPRHPYSRKLFSALPGVAKRGSALSVIPGQVPSLAQSFPGCRFVERCDLAMARCHREAPGWTTPAAGHAVRCFASDSGARSELAALQRADAGANTEAKTEAIEESKPRASAGTDTRAGARTGAGEVPDALGVARVSALPGAPAADQPLLVVRNLQVHFPIRRGILKRTVGQVRAVDDLSLTIHAGETLALVGESGCGKTTVGKAITRLIEPTAGEITLDGIDLTRLQGEALRARRAAFQIIFQDPYASLNPRMRVDQILLEGMRSLEVLADDDARMRRIDELLARVGLPPGAKSRYPHEFSGGQRQRLAIARALAVSPRLLICDEPTSALDVSVQAQILNLMAELQRDLGVAYLFITHNLGVVEYLAHRVAVMYLGRIVEQGNADEVLGRPRHPYTQSLLAAVPGLDGVDRRVALTGEAPSPINPPSGCHFHPRCPQARAQCRQQYPARIAVSGTHAVACVLS